MHSAVGKLVYLITRHLYVFIAKQYTWFTETKLDQGSLCELEFWQKNIECKNGHKIKSNPEVTRVIFSDASAYGYDGFSVTKKGKHLAKGIFSSAKMETSSTLRELLAVKYVLESFLEKN